MTEPEAPPMSQPMSTEELSEFFRMLPYQSNPNYHRLGATIAEKNRAIETLHAADLKGNCTSREAYDEYEDVCPVHDEPRGDCHECPPCPQCVREGDAREVMRGSTRRVEQR